MIDSKVADDHFELKSDALAATIRLSARGSAVVELYVASTTTIYICAHAGSKEQLLEELLHCVQRLIAGKLDPVITEGLGSCTLIIALAKPDGSMAPSAQLPSATEVLRRLAGKAICYQLKEVMRKFFFPFQYGVQTRSWWLRADCAHHGIASLATFYHGFDLTLSHGCPSPELPTWRLHEEPSV
jgi:hypothetical protein